MYILKPYIYLSRDVTALRPNTHFLGNTAHGTYTAGGAKIEVLRCVVVGKLFGPGCIVYRGFGTHIGMNHSAMQGFALAPFKDGTDHESLVGLTMS